MPYDRISAAGVQHGIMSDVDQANMEAARQQAAMKLQEMMAQQAREGQLSAAQIGADASKYNTQAQFASSGSFADRAAQESKMQQMQGDRSLGIVNAQMGPANRSADLQTKQWESGAAGREVGDLRNKMILQMLAKSQGAQAAPGAQAQPASAPVGPSMGATLIGTNPAMSDPSAMAQPSVAPEMPSPFTDSPMQGMIDAVTLANGGKVEDPYTRSLSRGTAKIDYDNALLASKRANTFGGDPATMEGTLGTDVSNFADKDTAMTGWDPGNPDVQRLLAGAQQLEKQIVAYYPKMKPEDVRQYVNKLIMDKIGNNANSWNSGWIQELLRQRGISQ